jgi:hypothetical protein
MRRRLLLTLVLLPTLAAPVSAGIIFGKKGAKTTPEQRVPELINTLMTSGDENKRSEAVEELRQYDSGQFPQIVPALIEVLANDKKPAVRAEAAQSLGKIRPVSQQAGQALEQALKDGSARVRLQARSSLLQYHWAGYRNDGKPATPPPTVNPPAVNSPAAAPPAPMQVKEPPPVVPSTKEPPLASPPPPAPTTQPPAATPPVARTTSAPRPLPTGPEQAPPLPAPAKTPPPSEEKGPDLIPPG